MDKLIKPINAYLKKNYKKDHNSCTIDYNLTNICKKRIQVKTNISLNPQLGKFGLKTGMYYLRTKPAANAIQFTVDKSKLKTSVKATGDGKQVNGKPTKEEVMLCSLQNKDECLMCGS